MPDADLTAASGAVAPRPLAAPAALRGPALALAAVRSCAAYLAVSTYILLVGPLALVAAAFSRSPDRLYVLGRFGVRLAMLISGLRSRVEGSEHLQTDRGAIYCANHESNLDPPILFLRLHPRLRVMFKAEMSRLPIFGRVMLAAGFVPVNRRSSNKSLAAIDDAVRRARLGESFLVFPEGTRSRDGNLLPFKKGGFIMALQAQVPIVPVAISGSRAAMAKGSPFIRPVTVRVRVGAPIETAGLTLDDRDRLIAEVRGRIESMLEGN